MNTSEYINSGILEAYVLGTATDQETREVECLSKIYPEIKAELTQLENSLGKYISFYQKTPPAHLKEKIFAQMTFAEPSEQSTTEQPASPAAEQPATKSLPLWPKLALAASVLLAAITAWVYTQNQQMSTQMATLSSQVDSLTTAQNSQTELLALFQNPDTDLIKLKGTDLSPQSQVKVYWNKQNHQVALVVDQLPTPDASHQYQLWTIVDGQPVDMGVLDHQSGKINLMKTTQGTVAAFAITLEKAGGSPSPTLEQMYVMAPVG